MENTQKNIPNKVELVIILFITMSIFSFKKENKNVCFLTKNAIAFSKSDSLQLSKLFETTYGVEEFNLSFMKRISNGKQFNLTTLIGNPISKNISNSLDLENYYSESNSLFDTPDKVNINHDYIYTISHVDAGMGSYWQYENYYIKYDKDYLFTEFLVRYRSDDSDRNKIIQSKHRLIEKLEELLFIKNKK